MRKILVQGVCDFIASQFINMLKMKANLIESFLRRKIVAFNAFKKEIKSLSSRKESDYENL